MLQRCHLPFRQNIRAMSVYLLCSANKIALVLTSPLLKSIKRIPCYSMPCDTGMYKVINTTFCFVCFLINGLFCIKLKDSVPSSILLSFVPRKTQFIGLQAGLKAMLNWMCHSSAPLAESLSSSLCLRLTSLLR